jgi:glycine dehydrogenase subunit 2
VGVVKKLVEFLPVPLVEKKGTQYVLQYKLPKTIGPLKAFYGNFGVHVRAYAYIRACGAQGLEKVSENAVLNANYLLAKLKKHYTVPFKRHCKHELVLSDKGMPNHITTTDIAKRLLDYGYHAPTIYFPLIVPGAIMIEPTETESKASLDAFADALIQIKKEAEQEPEKLKNAPNHTPVRRLDAVQAARHPILKWKPRPQGE